MSNPSSPVGPSPAGVVVMVTSSGIVTVQTTRDVEVLVIREAASTPLPHETRTHVQTLHHDGTVGEGELGVASIHDAARPDAVRFQINQFRDTGGAFC